MIAASDIAIAQPPSAERISIEELVANLKSAADAFRTARVECAESENRLERAQLANEAVFEARDSARKAVDIAEQALLKAVKGY